MWCTLMSWVQKWASFEKNLHSNLSHHKNLKINFEIFWSQPMIKHPNFSCTMNYLCLGARSLNLFFWEKKSWKISWKILWKIFGNFNFWDLAEKCFVETNNREQIFSRFLQNSKKNFPKFVWSVTNLSAKFLQKTPIFVLRTPMCIIYKILPRTFGK